jgi:glycosyltransferase involved in cell wall biosynthesis
VTEKISTDEPLVSICLPNLNTFRYLPERIDTIVRQTLTNWEMIVIDGFSDDGSWEFFERLARKDPRVWIEQAPRGLYESWNKCIRKARGKYVYIATSDDIMASDCLEKLVAALEEHSDCDMAHCNLVTIDKDGAAATGLKWPDTTVFAQGTPEWISQRHIRRAPYDGLLHLTGRMVYQSVTELLIRRSLFSRIGGFKANWGSIGDLYWDMKAGLVANTIHVPDTWASWRVYSTQQTASINFFSADHARKVGEMIGAAVTRCEAYLPPKVIAGLREHWLEWSSEMRDYYRGLWNRPGFLQRRGFQACHVGTRSVRAELIHRLFGKPKWPERAPSEIRNWLDSLGLGPVVTVESRRQELNEH